MPEPLSIYLNSLHLRLLAPPQRASPDIKAELFELLYQVLHQNWRYFFKTSVLASVQRGAAEDTMENEAQFTAAMQVSPSAMSAASLSLQPVKLQPNNYVVPFCCVDSGSRFS